MISTLFDILLAGLSIWQHEEATKYISKVTDLRARYYEEDKKAPGVRNDALLDDLRFQLLNLAAAFTAEVNASKVKT